MQKNAYIFINNEIFRCYISFRIKTDKSYIFRICQEARPIHPISAIIRLMNYNKNH